MIWQGPKAAANVVLFPLIEIPSLLIIDLTSDEKALICMLSGSALLVGVIPVLRKTRMTSSMIETASPSVCQL